MSSLFIPSSFEVVDSSGGSVTPADNKPWRGFIPAEDGTVGVRGSSDAAAVALPVVAGAQYLGEIAEFTDDGTVTDLVALK